MTLHAPWRSCYVCGVSTPKPYDFDQAATQASRDAGVALRCTGQHAFGAHLQAGRFELQNGLTLLLVPDMRAPIFAYQTWFRVGSKDEDPQRTGLAHLFEHLMFKGTHKHASGTFDREMERRGAQTNAATWVDWTYYQEALAVQGDNLATVIDFETDRMTNLVLDTATFTSELEVVKNERRMSVEDSVGGALSEELFALTFKEHAYRWPTIGSMAHLESASMADLEAFYRAHYAPNNATVVLVGALDPVPTLVQLARAYGPLQRQATRPRPTVVEPAQQAARHKEISRALVAPQLVVGYRAPAQGAPGYAALEMLAEMLVSGDTARLYQRLVTEKQLVTDISGFLAPFAEPGLFEFHATLRPGIDPQAVLSALQSELDAVAGSVTAGEINKAAQGLELGLLDSLKDVEGCAEALGHHQTNAHDFSRAFTQLEAYTGITAETLGQVAHSTFTPNGRSTVLALPSGEAPDANSDDV